MATAEDLLDEAGQGAGVKVFFANLDPVDAGALVALDEGKERLDAAGGAAVSDVAADHNRSRLRKDGRGYARRGPLRARS